MDGMSDGALNPSTYRERSVLTETAFERPFAITSARDPVGSLAGWTGAFRASESTEVSLHDPIES